MKHEEAYELLEAYAFGTAEPDQYDAIEAHLATGCEECNARLREIGDVSVRLATSVPQHTPPARIKEKLMERVHTQGLAPVTPIPSAPPRARANPWPWLVATASLAAMFVMIMTTFMMRGEIDAMRGQLTSAQSEISSMSDNMAVYQQTALLLGSRFTRTVDLTGMDPNPDASGKLFINPNEGTAVVYMFRLPQTPEGMEYQLWAMKDGKPMSLGVFTVKPDGSAMFRMDDMPEKFDVASFQVTIEPEGGDRQPTGMMYLQGPMPKDDTEIH